jgi:hypothetical protein
MRYTVVAVTEVDGDAVDAIGVHNNKIFVTGFGVDAMIIDVAQLHSES